MGKTRDLFKKMRDTKGTFHAKMGSIKDRNGMDLTEAEDGNVTYGKGNGKWLEKCFLPFSNERRRRPIIRSSLHFHGALCCSHRLAGIVSLYSDSHPRAMPGPAPGPSGTCTGTQLWWSLTKAALETWFHPQTGDNRRHFLRQLLRD